MDGETTRICVAATRLILWPISVSHGSRHGLLFYAAPRLELPHHPLLHPLEPPLRRLAHKLLFIPFSRLL